MKRHRNDTPPDPDTAELQRQIETLQHRTHRLQLEHDILKRANEILKTLGVNPQLLSNREKTLLVDALKSIYARTELLTTLNLPRSSYFYYCACLRKPDKYADARVAIVDVFRAITAATATDGYVSHWESASLTCLRRWFSAL